MEKKQKILEPRERLDKTLALPDLVNVESIKSLVRDQLSHSSLPGTEGNADVIIEKRTREVSHFLEMLRSASGNEDDALKACGALQKDWKLKQDTDELRVMYREGPEGTPFHTLLAEGYADGPIDVCLCVSWESTLYRKWWPQYSFPTFKITTSSCLQKIRSGEEISLIRMKVPWPISDREALLHYSEVEFFKEDLVLVLLNTIPDTEHIEISSHGFTRDGIPEAKDIVRVDLEGGLVLQKVSDNKSYFRVIANLDIKLDFVPPTLINFVSRQLIGNGHKLFQKAVRSVAMNDEDYQQALKGPMYARIRQCLDSIIKTETTSTVTEEKPRSLPSEQMRIGSAVENSPVTASTSITEIVEERTQQSKILNLGQLTNGTSTKLIHHRHVLKESAFISPEVEHALGILDNAIAILRGSRLSCNEIECSPDNRGLEASLGDGCSRKVATVGNDINILSNGCQADSPAKDSRLKNDWPADFSDIDVDVLSGCSRDKLTNGTITVKQFATSESMITVSDEGRLKTNGSYENSKYGDKSKRHRKNQKWLCCLSQSNVRG
ncbi:uncharacterized protein [Typha angustifolia]|uniref:uncharacterized protein n=1 Tax=Typha angustifolia TaxID=59011 RepID=UPI003C2F34AC